MLVPWYLNSTQNTMVNWVIRLLLSILYWPKVILLSGGLCTWKPSFVFPHKMLLLSFPWKAMEGKVSFSTVLTKKRILHRLPQVAFTCLARESWLSGVVITQQRILTLLANALTLSDWWDRLGETSCDEKFWMAEFYCKSDICYNAQPSLKAVLKTKILICV